MYSTFPWGSITSSLGHISASYLRDRSPLESKTTFAFTPHLWIKPCASALPSEETIVSSSRCPNRCSRPKTELAFSQREQPQTKSTGPANRVVSLDCGSAEQLLPR